MRKAIGEYLIQFIRPLNADNSIPDIDIYNEVFALDSTTILLSIKTFQLGTG